MLDPTGLYDSARLAAGYAFARPPVHPRVADLFRTHLGIVVPRPRALDVGCGAGRSTAALAPLARVVVGLEPSRVMLQHHAAVAPAAHVVNARAEQLPFRDGAFDLITAAGALNYVDLTQCLPAVARVLAADGVFVVYDFSSGRRSPDAPPLAGWFDGFERRYPFPAGYELDVRGIEFGRHGLRLAVYETFEVALAMAPAAYLQYVMTESNVERAVAAGVPEREIHDWCVETLGPVFDGRALPVVFDGYFACIERATPSAYRGRDN
jgi:ubiquinone/menaquinone biosynthesis C-methylase UbiE